MAENIVMRIADIQLSLLRIVFPSDMKPLRFEDANKERPKEVCEDIRALFEPFDGVHPYYLFNYAHMIGNPIEETICDVYHEMIHYYCWLRGIRDHVFLKNGTCYHTLAFKAAVEANRGFCVFSETDSGYFLAFLQHDAMYEVRDDVLEKEKWNVFL